MADNQTRIGSSLPTTGMDLLRQISGVGSVSPTTGGGGGGAVAATGGGSGGGQAGAFGPRGSRVLPADYPMDQLDRSAARGTYLDILV
ncbi:hypothetical protein [Magnetospirillum aberrantis]|uniref:Uncharacterized protein n=1 Tax=Magnetospirillum aberrantis SpK TaxID=908842 RepID=A0A7C9UVF0_9PROT|nr:hypothetical protein [Magnetospirillum aberrantis]NFV81368.1 hypothetical protein [Magnetospirillum aberrantis SpK]